MVWLTTGVGLFVAYQKAIPLTNLPLVPHLMRQWKVSPLVQIMACRLVGAKPFPEPRMVYCQLDAQEQVSMKLESEFYHFHSIKCVWKCRLPKWRPFCQGKDRLMKFKFWLRNGRASLQPVSSCNWKCRSKSVCSCRWLHWIRQLMPVVYKPVTIGSGNGLLLSQRQSITRANVILVWIRNKLQKHFNKKILQSSL